MSEPDGVLGRLGQDRLDKLPVTAVIGPFNPSSLQLKVALQQHNLLGMQQQTDVRSHPPELPGLLLCNY